MSYEALYRKWRPRVFEDVLSQEYTVRILKNQVKSSNISHAYLFTGMRGTGKTTTARIFARAINCTNIQDGNPCNECEMCKGILEESLMNVIEIDAASNRGIENIRELREYAKFNPAKGRYKIYIIDEAHMLTGDASNAFLKLLEEPPDHIIFILATTELEKLIDTIKSRCQIFNFKPVRVGDIKKQLALICESMSIKYEEDALDLIALNASGGMRDALSILDRCISFNDEVLSHEDVIGLLGLVNYQTIFDLVESVAGQDTSRALTLTNEIFAEGKNPGQLITDLIGHFRKLLLAQMDVKTDELISLSKERLDQLREQGKLFNPNQLSYFIHTLSDIESRLRYALQPKVLVEIAIVSLCNKELNDSLEGLIERVKELERIVSPGQLGPGKEEGPVHGRDKARDIEDIPAGKDRASSLEDEKGLAREDMVRDHKEEDRDQVAGSLDKGRVSEEKSIDRGQDLKVIENVWQDLLNQMRRDKRAQIEAFLKEGRLEKLEAGILTISLKEGFEFHRDRLDKEDVKDYISSLIKKFTDRDIRLAFVMEDDLVDGDRADRKGEEGIKDPLEKLRKTLPGEIFDAIEIIDG